MVSFNGVAGKELKACFRPENIDQFKAKALQWADSFDVCTYLDNNEIAYPEGGFQNLLAVGVKRKLEVGEEGTFDSLQRMYDTRPSWLFGFMTYDLKNEVEDLTSANTDGVNMPKVFFYEPEYLLRFTSEKNVEVLQADNPHALFQMIEQIELSDQNPVESGIVVKPKIAQADYIDTVKKIQQHIVEGDVYELNFCMEFFAENIEASPLDLFKELSKVSPMPFAAYHKLNDRFLVSASPERFIKKTGDRMVSQPIKGTIRRGENEEEDQRLKHQLRNDEKEIAENMMIVDLVRNDLARSSEVGSVRVPELFGIYGFRQVFQMISTIEGKLKEDISFIEAIKYAFPMGSMTGAPKVKSMELIEKYEQSRRGLYSGTVGYITPEGDFDFNVIIRSILYNEVEKYLSFQIGSAITIDALPEKEYDECLLKAKAILKVLDTEIA